MLEWQAERGRGEGAGRTVAVENVEAVDGHGGRKAELQALSLEAGVLRLSFWMEWKKTGEGGLYREGGEAEVGCEGRFVCRW